MPFPHGSFAGQGTYQPLQEILPAWTDSLVMNELEDRAAADADLFVRESEGPQAIVQLSRLICNPGRRKFGLPDGGNTFLWAIASREPAFPAGARGPIKGASSFRQPATMLGVLGVNLGFEMLKWNRTRAGTRPSRKDE
jgi:hypothetical protein